MDRSFVALIQYWLTFLSLQWTFWTSDCCEPVIVWISAWGKLTVRLSERSFGEFCSIERANLLVYSWHRLFIPCRSRFGKRSSICVWLRWVLTDGQFFPGKISRIVFIAHWFMHSFARIDSRELLCLVYSCHRLIWVNARLLNWTFDRFTRIIPAIDWFTLQIVKFVWFPYE